MNVSRRSGRSTAKTAVTSLISAAAVLGAVLVGGASAASAHNSLQESGAPVPANGGVIGWD